MRSREGPRGVRPLARGRSGRKRRSRRLLTLFLPGSHGTGWSPDYSPDYSHLAILRRSRQSGRRQVRSTIRCRWIALRFAWHRERTGADRCRASAREPLSIRVRQRVRTSPSDPFADLKRRAPVARPIRAGGCPVRAPCRARPAQAPGTAAGARPPAARRTPSGSGSARSRPVAPDLDRQRPDAGGQGCRRSGLSRSGLSRSGLSRSGLARGARPGHAVAYAAHVEDPGRVRRVVAELLVELFHEGAHDLGVAVAPPGPDPVQQRLGGRDPSGALSARARSSSYSVAVSSTSRPAGACGSRRRAR